MFFLRKKHHKVLDGTKQQCSDFGPIQKSSASKSEIMIKLASSSKTTTMHALVGIIISPPDLPTAAHLTYRDGADPHESADYKVSNDLFLFNFFSQGVSFLLLWLEGLMPFSVKACQIG